MARVCANLRQKVKWRARRNGRPTARESSFTTWTPNIRSLLACLGKPRHRSSPWTSPRASRREHTSSPGLKVSPQFLSADRIGYLIKGPGQKGELAFTTGEHGADAPAPGVIRNPAWSPDGKQLVYEKFAYDSKQNQPLYAKDQTFDLRFSGEFPAISRIGKLALSPFGDVSALRITPFDKIAVYVSDLDGTNRKQLFQQDWGGAFSPSWSPDGQWVVFGYGAVFKERESKPSQLVMIRADGSQKRELTSGPLNNGFPSWSPDGKRIVYRVWSKEERSLQILNLDDGKSTKLTSGNDNFPVWSPLGDRVCFTRDTGGTNSYEIFTIGPNGTDLNSLAQREKCSGSVSGWVRNAQ